MHRRINITPAPDRVLIKITKRQTEELTSKWITRDDGSKVKLFTEPEFDKGFDRKFMQNVSVGTVLAVGENIKNIKPSDIAIIDYLVTNNDDVLIGYVGTDQVVCIKPETTYHKDSALPSQSGRKGWIEGDFDYISQILGIVRGDKVIAFAPYIFLVAKSNLIVTNLVGGKTLETVELISRREVLAAPEGSGYDQGDEIVIKEMDMFSRMVNEKEISVIFDRDVMAKKSKK